MRLAAGTWRKWMAVMWTTQNRDPLFRAVTSPFNECIGVIRIAAHTLVPCLMVSDTDDWTCAWDRRYIMNRARAMDTGRSRFVCDRCCWNTPRACWCHIKFHPLTFLSHLLQHHWQHIYCVALAALAYCIHAWCWQQCTEAHITVTMYRCSCARGNAPMPIRQKQYDSLMWVEHLSQDRRHERTLAGTNAHNVI